MLSLTPDAILNPFTLTLSTNESDVMADGFPVGWILGVIKRHSSFLHILQGLTDSGVQLRQFTRFQPQEHGASEHIN